MSTKVMFLGSGVVGQSLLDLLLKEGIFSEEDIFVVDCSEDALDGFVKYGGKRENTRLYPVNGTNYLELLDRLESGDFLICLANSMDSLKFSGECLRRGIHYISACDDCFIDEQPDEYFRYRDHFYEYRKLAGTSAGSATSVIQFGVNPGLISVLTKQALIDIVNKDPGEYVAENREHLAGLLSENRFADLAEELGVTTFLETDLDVTETNIKEHRHTVYSTWNVPDYNEEMFDRIILTKGTGVSLSEQLNRIGVSQDDVFYYNKADGTLVLDKAGKDVMVKGFCGDRYFEGCLDAHEEVLTIHDYFTKRNEDNEIIYAPSVLFVYRPCELALRSVHHARNTRYGLITKDMMVSGGEGLGMCVEGKNFTDRYVGVELKYDEGRFETPSVLLVSLSVYAAVRYIISHPDEGLLFPEYLDPAEVISYIEKYMPVISKEIPLG